MADLIIGGSDAGCCQPCLISRENDALSTGPPHLGSFPGCVTSLALRSARFGTLYPRRKLSWLQFDLGEVSPKMLYPRKFHREKERTSLAGFVFCSY